MWGEREREREREREKLKRALQISLRPRILTIFILYCNNQRRLANYDSGIGGGQAHSEHFLYVLKDGIVDDSHEEALLSIFSNTTSKEQGPVQYSKVTPLWVGKGAIEH